MKRFIIITLIIQSAVAYPVCADSSGKAAERDSPSRPAAAKRSGDPGYGGASGEVWVAERGTNSGAENVAESETAGIENDTNCTVITSRKLTFDQKKSTVVFEGNVLVADPALKIESDRLTVLLSNDKKVELIKAEGSVVISKDTIQAMSQMASYAVSNGKITLSGKPSVTRQKDNLTAETIVLWRNSNRIICEPHAHLIIYSNPNTPNQEKP